MPSCSCSVPAHSARVVEVVLVDCERGEGALKRSVLQVWSKQGDLLAEHDRIHADPIYAALFLRGRVDAQWLEVFAQAATETVAQGVA